MSIELWKIISGFDKYQISNFGNVRNKKSKYILKQKVKDGYKTVKLAQNGSKDKRVHILVAQEFLALPTKDQIVVNHKDGDKFNNTPLNLEWTTIAQNTQHARNIGLLVPYMRKVYKLNPNTREILHIFKNIKEFNKEMKSCDATIKHVSENDIIYKGFKWEIETREQKIENCNSIWKQFRDSNYSVSDSGQIKNIKTERILKTELISGYQRFKIKINDKLTPFYIHRVVAEVFILNPTNLEYVDHIDGNPLNNTVSNLRWVTHKDNTRYACAISVDQLDLEGNLIKTWPCMSDARKIYGSHISCCVRGKVSTVHGFRWRYTNESLRCS